MRNRGHTWKKDETGEVDIFGYETGDFHNGPVCVRCGYGFCHHCRTHPARGCPEALQRQVKGDGPMRTENITIRVTLDDRDELRRLARERNMTMSRMLLEGVLG